MGRLVFWAGSTGRWAIFLFAFLALWTGFAWSRSTETSDAERDRVWAQHFADHLPEFCKYTQSLPNHNGSGGGGLKGAYGHPLSTEKYRKMFGKETWHDMHHYCHGLEFMYRAGNSIDPAEKAFWYRNALGAFDYVLVRAAQPFLLEAEGLLNKGIALLNLDDPIQGVLCLSQAIEVDPEYLPAYVALSNYFERSGDREQAIAILESGLTNIPQSRLLEENLARIRAESASSSVARSRP